MRATEYSIWHSGTKVEQGCPEATRLAFADQIRRSAAFKFLHLAQQPRADFFGLHQLLEFVVNALNLPQLRRVNRTDRVALLPIHDGAVGSVNHVRDLIATPAQRRSQFG